MSLNSSNMVAATEKLRKIPQLKKNGLRKIQDALTWLTLHSLLLNDPLTPSG